jgi:hypothetical protein
MGEATYRAWWPTEYFRWPTAEEVRSCALTFASHDRRVTT